MALGILGGITAAGLSGCSAIPKIPGLGGGDSPAILDRVDPAAAGKLPFLSFTMMRPTAMAEVMELTPESGSWKERPDIQHLFGVSDPFEQCIPPLNAETALSGKDLLLVPSATLHVLGSLGSGVTLWDGGAQVLDQAEEMLEGAYIREGDTLRKDPAPKADHWRVTTIVAFGHDLVFSSNDDPPAFVDTDTGLSSEFIDLSGLFKATGIDEPHLAHGRRVPKDFPFNTENSTISEWVYATEIISTAEQTTRGAIRAEGDLEELRKALHEGAQQFEGFSLRLSETEIDGDLVLLTLTYDENAELPDLATLASFYKHMPEVGWPGISLEAG